MEKQVITIKKETTDYPCNICGRMVIVALATPWTIETDKTIIHTWNYGHQHSRTYEFVNGVKTQLENTEDQSYE